MAEQRLQTQILLDAALTSGYRSAFDSAGKLLSDMKKQSSDLRKQLGVLGKEADEVEKIGGAADEVRKSMKLLERQIDETERATQKFGEARAHFRSASIGAKALKSDIGAIAEKAKMAALAIAGIGTAAAVALSPSEELLAFDQTLGRIAFQSPDVDTSGVADDIRDLSNTYGVSANEIAKQHEQLTRNLGFEDAQETITAAVEFQKTTGMSITDIEDELGTARISLGIDTPAETREFLELLQGAYREGIKIDNIDLGDLETLRGRTGEDVFGENFQREFLTTIAFKQTDSFQYADYAASFDEEIKRAVKITPEMDTKEIDKAQDAIRALAKWGIRAEDGLVGAMEVYQQLNEADKVAFFTELEPVLTAMPAEVIARGSEVLPEITQQVNTILNSDVSMSDAAADMKDQWSDQWIRMREISKNTLDILREQFASVFGVSMVETSQKLFNFLSSRQEQIRNFFTGIRDGASPVVSRVWNVIREAYPDVKQFAMDVWTELRKQWDAIAPAAKFVADTIWNIFKAVTGFLKDHPRLVATVIAGVAAWKGYKIVSNIFGTAGDAIKGFVSLAQGHIHRLNAIVFENIRVQGGLQKTTLSTGQKFLTMGRDMLATKFPKLGTVASGAANIGRSALAAIPGIGAMGASLWGAVAPILPVVLPVVAAIGAVAAGGYLIYKHWEPIKQFFVDNFDTIRNVMWFVSPPIGFLMTAAQFIMRNWEPIKEFFMTVGETIKLVFQVVFEAIKFVFLQGALFVKNVWGGITDFFKNVWAGVTAVFTKSPLAPIFNLMVGGVKKVVSPLFGFFDNFWENIFDKGKAVIKWITDKFNFVNNLLKKAFGWLRKKNKEAVAELKEQAGDEIKAQVDVPNAIDEVNQEIDAVLEAKKPEPAAEDMRETKTPMSEVINKVKVSPQVSIPSPEMPAMESAKVVNEIKVSSPQVAMPPFEMPTITTPPVNVTTPKTTQPDISVQSPEVVQRDNIPNPRVVIGDDMVKTALGILAESRKQTDILSILVEYSKRPAVDNIGQYETEIIESQMRDVIVPQTPVPEVENHIDIAAPVVNVKTPEPAITEVKHPQIDIPQIPVPEVVNHVDVAASVVNLKTPEPAVAEMKHPQIDIPQMLVPEVVNHIDIAAPVLNLKVPDPAIAEVKQPKVDIPQVAAPKVVNHIDIAAPVVNVKVPDPAIVELQQPQIDLPDPAAADAKNQIDVSTPDVQIAEADPAVVEMQKPEPAIVELQQPNVEIPQLAAPKVDNQIDIASPSVEIAQTNPAVLDIHNPISVMPEVQQPSIDVPQIATPEVVNHIEIVLPDVSIAKPDPAVVEMQASEPGILETLQPVVDFPQIEAPEVVNQIGVASPKVDIAESDPAVVAIQNPEPVVVEMQAPEPSILETRQPQIDVPQVDAPDVVNQIKVASPEVELRQADPAVVDIQAPVPSILETQPQMDFPEVATPEVVNHIAVTSPKLDIAAPEAAIVNLKTPEPAVQDIPKIEMGAVDISVPELQSISEVRNQIDVAPVVTPVSLDMADTAISDIQQPIVNLQYPSPNGDPLRMDGIWDKLLDVGLGVLEATRKQIGILESLSFEPIFETAPVVMETPKLVLDDGGLFLDDGGQPDETTQEQQITHHEQVTNQTSTPTVEVVNNFHIVAQSDQDPEALAELIAAIVMSKVDEAADTFLVT